MVFKRTSKTLKRLTITLPIFAVLIMALGYQNCSKLEFERSPLETGNQIPDEVTTTGQWVETESPMAEPQNNVSSEASIVTQENKTYAVSLTNPSCTVQVTNGGPDFSPSAVGQLCTSNEDPVVKNSRGWYTCQCTKDSGLLVYSLRASQPLNEYFDIYIENVSNGGDLSDSLYACLEIPGVTGCSNPKAYRLITGGDPASYTYDQANRRFHFHENYGNLGRPAGLYKIYFRRGNTALNVPKVLYFNLTSGTKIEPALFNCQPNKSNVPNTNPHSEYGLVALSNANIDPSLTFKVVPAQRVESDGTIKLGMRTTITNSKGENICVLEGGPMLRSPNNIPSKGLNVPMTMSFEMTTKNYFANSRYQPAPHIPIVLLGGMGSFASEGIGPIFGNLSTFPRSGRCSPPANGDNNNYALIESYRNTKVCIFGDETGNNIPLTDQKYFVNIEAKPIDVGGVIKNSITYTLKNSMGQIVASSNNFHDDPRGGEGHGGWLIFNVIGPVTPFEYEFSVKNLKINY